MASESDSEHDGREPHVASVASFDDCFDAATPGGQRSSADTRADTIEWIASIRDIHFAWNEPERAPEPSRWSDYEWLLSLKCELHTKIDVHATPDTTADSPEPGEWWRISLTSPWT